MRYRDKSILDSMQRVLDAKSALDKCDSRHERRVLQNAIDESNRLMEEDRND